MVVAPASFLVIRHLRPKLGWTAGDFGDRFWVYQIVDQRTDSFAQVGKMYGTKPGFYLLAGPLEWNGAFGYHRSLSRKDNARCRDSACLQGRYT